MRGQEERQEDNTANDDAPVHVIPGVACGAGADGVIRWDGREGWVDDVEAVLLCAGERQCLAQGSLEVWKRDGRCGLTVWPATVI